MPLGIHIAVGNVPDEQLGAASLVEVIERLGETTSYRLRYDADIAKDDIPMLVDPRLGPSSELSVLAPHDGKVHCLVKGPVHRQRIHMEHGGGGSWVDVCGGDASVKMDAQAKITAWNGVKDSDVVKAIVAPYGLLPDVEATASVNAEATHTLIQRESDLHLVRRLAHRNGMAFWVDCDDKGLQTAHFRRPKLDSAPAAKLVINQSSQNLTSVDIEWDVQAPTQAAARNLDLGSKQVLDGTSAESGLRPLGAQPLSAIVGSPRGILLAAPADDAGALLARARGALAEGQWFVRLTAKVTLADVGVVLRPHTVVELAGAGSRHSGKWLVRAVRHAVDARAHRMDLELVRNAWGMA